MQITKADIANLRRAMDGTKDALVGMVMRQEESRQRLRAALQSTREFIEIWRADAIAGLPPTPGSLAKAEEGILEALKESSDGN